MDMEKMIQRINELYHKSKNIGLCESEKIEQDNLRKEYVKIIKGNFKNQLQNFEKKE